MNVVKDLERLTRLLNEEGLIVSRHSYSYILIYEGALIASIHVYPGYNEISLRLYRLQKTLASMVYPRILNAIKRVFPKYRIIVGWYPESTPPL